MRSLQTLNIKNTVFFKIICKITLDSIAICRSLAYYIQPSINILICLYICLIENFVIDLTELTTIPKDDHAPHALETDEVTEQVGLNCPGHSGKFLVTSAYPYP